MSLSPLAAVCSPGWRGIVQLVLIVFLSRAFGTESRTRSLLRDGRQPQQFSQAGVSEPSSMLAFGGMPVPNGFSYDFNIMPNLQQRSDSGVGATLGAAAVGTLETALLGAEPPKPPPVISDAADGSEDESSSNDNAEMGTSDSAVAAQTLAEDESIASHPGEEPSEESVKNQPVAGTTDSESANLDAQQDKPKVPGAIVLSAQPLDVLARATLQVEKQTETVKRSKASNSPPLVSMSVCGQAQKQLKALSCNLVTQISGYPEGCECRIKAKKCPGVLANLGFTGVSPSVPFTPPQLGGASVILCMYWQWLKPPDRSAESDVPFQETKELATRLVVDTNKYAETVAKTIATQLYAYTTTFPIPSTTYPIPPTPMPIWEPIRFMSTTAYPLWGPAPSPGGARYGVSFTVLILALNYAMLAANPTLTYALKDTLQRAIALQAGVQPFHVSLNLGAGSIIVDVFISPASGIPDLDLVSKLSYSPTFLGVLTNFIGTVPGIMSYAVGAISIQWIRRPSVGLSRYAPSPGPMGYFTGFGPGPSPYPYPGPSPGPMPMNFNFVPFNPFGGMVPAPAPRPFLVPGPAPAPAVR